MRVHTTAYRHDCVSCDRRVLGLRPLGSPAHGTSGARRAPRKTPPPPRSPPRGHAAPTAHRPDAEPAEGLERSGRGGREAARGRAGVGVVARSAGARPYPRLSECTPSTSHVWTSVPRPPKKNPNVRRLYDVPTRDAACRTRDGFIADSMDIRYRALWISRVDGASSMPDGAHWLAQSRSPQTPSRRAGCGSLMWAALSMSICVIILGGVLRLAEAAAAAVA